MSESEKIDLLIIRYLDGDIQAEDTLTLQRWMQENDANVHYFTKIKKIWDSCHTLGNTPEELEMALERFRKNCKPPVRFQPTHQRRIPTWMYRAAAIFIIGIALYALNQYLSRNELHQENMIQTVSTNRVIIEKGQKGQIILSDGTKVWLNSGSTLEYPGVFGAEREVSLNGEAYFEVKSNEAHPFLVQTPKLKIKVTGTTFNIKAYETDDVIETTLVEGRLSILNNNRELVVLQPKETAVYSQKENSINISKLETETQIKVTATQTTKARTDELTPAELVGAWKENKLIFNDEPLGTMIAKLERWFDRKIHVSDPDLLTNEYNGKFVYNETIYQVLDVICRSSDNLKYREVNHEFYISKK